MLDSPRASTSYHLELVIVDPNYRNHLTTRAIDVSSYVGIWSEGKRGAKRKAPNKLH
jgi:hypothetical protein